MQAGRLNDRISIWRIDKVRDEYGGITPTEVLVYDGHAEVTFAKTSLTTTDHEAFYSITRKVRVRTTSNWIKPDMLVKYNGESYRMIGAPEFVRPEHISVLQLALINE